MRELSWASNSGSERETQEAFMEGWVPKQGFRWWFNQKLRRRKESYRSGAGSWGSRNFSQCNNKRAELDCLSVWPLTLTVASPVGAGFWCNSFCWQEHSSKILSRNEGDWPRRVNLLGVTSFSCHCPERWPKATGWHPGNMYQLGVNCPMTSAHGEKLSKTAAVEMLTTPMEFIGALGVACHYSGDSGELG